jgi:TPR repeat protein
MIIDMKITSLAVVLAILGIPGHANADASTMSQPRRMDQDLRLAKRQISSLEKLAQAGDNEAAAKLARYFDFYVHDYETAKLWFEKAARNGHVQSQYNLGVRLMTKRKDAESCREAQSWFNMALANGSLKAQRALVELGPCPTSESAR